MKVSFCVHSFNEADALRRLVLSSLPLAHLCDEWVIVDHRSDDDTPAVLAELEPVLRQAGIRLRTHREDRDLSRDYTFAQLRNDTITRATNPIVVLQDADFVLGPKFAGLVRRGMASLTAAGSPYYGAAYSVPCVWDELTTNASGQVTHHGRVWVHQLRPRILWKDAIHYEQVGDGGRWEKLILDSTDRRQRLDLTENRKGRLTPHTLVSVNVKPPDRIALRDTMTMFMQDAMQGVVTGDWLENYAIGTVRSQPPYPYQKRDLRGWSLHTPNLSLSSASPARA